MVHTQLLTATELQNKNLTNIFRERNIFKHIPVITAAIQPKKRCYALRFYGILEILQSF